MADRQVTICPQCCVRLGHDGKRATCPGCLHILEFRGGQVSQIWRMGAELREGFEKQWRRVA